MLRNGWLHTGDGAWMDEDGFVYIVDRLKDMIVSGGENVYSGEVENAIFQHEHVRECAVIAVPDPQWGEAVHAIVVPKDGARLDPETVIARLPHPDRGLQMPALGRHPARAAAADRLRQDHEVGAARREVAGLYEVGQLMQEAAKRSDDVPDAAPDLRARPCVNDDAVRSALARHRSRISGQPDGDHELRPQIVGLLLDHLRFRGALLLRRPQADPAASVRRAGCLRLYSVLPQVYCAASRWPAPAFPFRRWCHQNRMAPRSAFLLHLRACRRRRSGALGGERARSRAQARDRPAVRRDPRLAAPDRRGHDALCVVAAGRRARGAAARSPAGAPRSRARRRAIIHCSIGADRWLQDNCPQPPRRTIVHGDYRIGNFIEDKGRITAILDWELTHLGDPHEDLALGDDADLQRQEPEALRRARARRGDRPLPARLGYSGLATEDLAFYEAYALYQAAGDPDVCGARLRGRPLQRHAPCGDGKPDALDRACALERALEAARMSASFERLIDGIIDALQSQRRAEQQRRFRPRAGVLRDLRPERASSSTADWQAGPLLEQVRLQDDTFAAVSRLADGMMHPEIPATPRIRRRDVRPCRDRGAARRWRPAARAASALGRGEVARAADRDIATEIERLLRRAICDQLKIELATTPKSMLQQIAGGERDGGAAQG